MYFVSLSHLESACVIGFLSIFELILDIWAILSHHHHLYSFLGILSHWLLMQFWVSFLAFSDIPSNCCHAFCHFESLWAIFSHLESSLLILSHLESLASNAVLSQFWTFWVILSRLESSWISLSQPWPPLSRPRSSLSWPRPSVSRPRPSI